MDYTLLISVIGIGIVYFYLKLDKRKSYKKNKIIGDKGESAVSLELEKLGNDYRVYNYIYVGKSQIDHLVICDAAKEIFVIETKRWAGIITGDTKDKEWRQDKNGVIKYYQNPIIQNRIHCNAVRRKYEDYIVHNVVVFVWNNNVPNHKSIVKLNDLVYYINKTTNKVYNRGIIEV